MDAAVVLIGSDPELACLAALQREELLRAPLPVHNATYEVKDAAGL